MSVLSKKRKHGNFYWSDSRMKSKHRSRISVHFFLAVSIEEKREDGPIGAERRLDYVRDEALTARLVAPEKLFAAVGCVLTQVETAPAGDSLEF
jgi:hypothetical protein